MWLCLPAVWRVCWCGWSGFRGLSAPLVVRSLLLSALLLCACRVACKYGSISRFKGVFSAFCGVCVGLLGLGALRGLCGFCARVELGGLKACGVFASVFLLLSLCLLSFYALLFFFALVVFICPFALSLLFPFPLRTIHKKKGRAVLVRPLLSCCVLFVSLVPCALLLAS